MLVCRARANLKSRLKRCNVPKKPCPFISIGYALTSSPFYTDTIYRRLPSNAPGIETKNKDECDRLNEAAGSFWLKVQNLPATSENSGS